MKALRDPRAILAIDPTSEGLAFAFFELGEVLDWGTRRRPQEGGDVALVERLLGGYAPAAVVLENCDAAASRRYPRVRQVLRNLAAYARGHGIEVVVVSRADVHAAWRERGATNKHEAAALIAARIPELQAVVPPKRKVTKNEDRRADIFDAVTLALHVFGAPELFP